MPPTFLCDDFINVKYPNNWNEMCWHPETKSIISVWYELADMQLLLKLRYKYGNSLFLNIKYTWMNLWKYIHECIRNYIDPKWLYIFIDTCTLYINNRLVVTVIT